MLKYALDQIHFAFVHISVSETHPAWRPLLRLFLFVNKALARQIQCLLVRFEHETSLEHASVWQMFIFLCDYPKRVLKCVFPKNSKHYINSFNRHIKSLRLALTDIKERPIIGGWEEQQKNEMEKVDDKIVYKGIDLIPSVDLELRIIQILIISEVQLLNLLSWTYQLANKWNNWAIYSIHHEFGHDLNLASSSLQHNELCHLKNELSLGDNLKQCIKILNQGGCCKEVATDMARIVACTPHSADVERCISANNLVKTSLRNSISLETEQKYLFIYFNMPPLQNYDPRRAVTTWLNDKKKEDTQKNIEFDD